MHHGVEFVRVQPYLNCRITLELIPDYLSASIAAAARGALETHLDECADCAAFLRTYQKTIELTRAVLHRQEFAKPLRLPLSPGPGQTALERTR